jgi:hypothetical protein
MNRGSRTTLQIALVVVVLVVLFLLFPVAFAFVEMAARSLRYFWWLILLVALALWLIWGVGRSPRK